MTLKRFALDRIAANPFQTRLEEDPAQVARVAESIASLGERARTAGGELVDGLLQKPIARPAPAGSEADVQLAFGHMRLAAFRQLAREDPQAWGYMDVDVRELSDEEMFELAVRENLDRKDLTPIEQARAMATYRDRFRKTSAEVGQLFGLSDSAVRNKLRLLDLPEPVQVQVQAGDIQEGAARRLLALHRIAPQEIVQVAKELVDEKVETREGIFERVSEVLNEHALHMGENRYYYRHFDGNDGEEDAKGRAGTGLWPFPWKGTVARPTPAALLKLLEAHGVVEKGALEPTALVPYIEAYLSEADVDDVVKLFGISEELAAWIRQFVAPPPCSACDFHQVLDGSHYCGIKECWEQKRKAWIAAETARVSRKLGIPVHDAGADGKAFVRAETRYSTTGDHQVLEPAWQKMLQAKDSSLRVRGRAPDYRPDVVTKSYVVELVRVGPAAEKAKAAKKRREEGRPQYDFEAEQRKMEEARKRGEAATRFIVEEAAPLFAPLLKGLESVGLLEALAQITTSRRWDSSWKRRLPAKRGARCAALRELIAVDLLEDFVDHRSRELGPTATAKRLVGVAKSLGVRLPADWTKRAAALEPKIPSANGKKNGKAVSRETEGDDED